MSTDKLKEMQKVHYDSTTPMDTYNTGFYNGIEYSLCVLENTEPKYKNVEKPSARKFHLESTIKAHMEAMRPLLDEWSKLNDNIN